MSGCMFSTTSHSSIFDFKAILLFIDIYINLFDPWWCDTEISIFLCVQRLQNLRNFLILGLLAVTWRSRAVWHTIANVNMLSENGWGIFGVSMIFREISWFLLHFELMNFFHSGCDWADCLWSTSLREKSPLRQIWLLHVLLPPTAYLVMISFEVWRIVPPMCVQIHMQADAVCQGLFLQHRSSKINHMVHSNQPWFLFTRTSPLKSFEAGWSPVKSVEVGDSL